MLNNTTESRYQRGFFRSRPDGFILLATLLALSLFAVVLVDVCRRSGRHAGVAVEAVGELRKRWGAISIRTTLLPVAEQVLVDRERGGKTGISTCRGKLSLGGQDYEVILADEQAKANINEVVHLYGRERLGSTVRHLIDDPSGRLRIDLSQGGVLTNHFQGEGRFESWSQVFVNPAPERLLGRFSETRNQPVGKITCWGDGKLNLRRAADDVVELMLKPFVPAKTIRELLKAREANRRGTLETWLGEVELSDEDRRRLEEALTDQSQAHSLTILLRDNRRDSHELIVATQMVRPETDVKSRREAQPLNKTYRWVW